MLITVLFVIMLLNNNLLIPLKEVNLSEEKSSFDIANPSFTIKSKKGINVNEFHFKGNREKIRLVSVEKAIDMISSFI